MPWRVENLEAFRCNLSSGRPYVPWTVVEDPGDTEVGEGHPAPIEVMLECGSHKEEAGCRS